MPNYQDGKIYSIRSPNIDKYYLGSTTQTLCKRMVGHRTDNATSKQIIDAGEAYIELIENFPCNSKEELRKREGELIRLHKADLVNRCIAGRTKKIYYEDNKDILLQKVKTYYQNNIEHKAIYSKQYNQDNKDILKVKQHQYREDNKEELLTKKKLYHQENKSDILKKKKLYYSINHDTIINKRKLNYTCECGSTIRVVQKAPHNKSKIHIAFIETHQQLTH